MKKNIICVCGARPNFMKIAPLMRCLAKYKNKARVKLVHTGQHYDYEMSEAFFGDLDLPRPDIFLNIGPAPRARQLSRIETAFDDVLKKERPDLVVVVGDVNSTLACAKAAAKRHVPVAHVEAGLRSFDPAMPEESNRRITDSLSDFLFVTEKSGMANLEKEGIPPEKVFFVGNVMIDTLLYSMNKIDRSDINSRLKISRRRYAVLTLHRPCNVDSKGRLMKALRIVKRIAAMLPVVYPVHPRAAKMITKNGLLKEFLSVKGLHMTQPLVYSDFIKLVKESRFILTDSGGIQEEAVILKVPCLTMRKNTERPVTLEQGANYIVGMDENKIMSRVRAVVSGRPLRIRAPKLWDGKAAERIAHMICERKT